MEGWNRWIGKKIFLRIKGDRVYSGVVKEVQDIGNDSFFISFIDKFGNWVTIVNSEIIEIKEEKDG